MTSIQPEIDDKISIHTPSSTKDVSVPGDVELSSTYNHVYNTGTENTNFKMFQEHEKDSDLSNK